MQTVSYMFMEEKLSLGIYFITSFTLYAKVVALQHRSSDRLIRNSANSFHPLCQSSMVQQLHFLSVQRSIVLSYSQSILPSILLFQIFYSLVIPLSPLFSQLHQSSDFSWTNLSIFESIYLYKTWSCTTTTMKVEEKDTQFCDDVCAIAAVEEVLL